MAKTSSNDDTMSSELKNGKKSKKEKTKSIGDENKDEDINPDLKSKKHKRKKSKSDNSEEVVSTKKAKKPNSKKAEKMEEGEENEDNEPQEEETTTKSKKTPSKRQIKRDKKALRESEKKDASKQESMNKALNYISTWKHARNQWKFEKLKQIWLMDHLLDDALVPDEFFPTVLEYFEGCKGMARETLLKKGMDIIKKYEQKQEDNEEFEEPVEYKRARELLQALPTET